MRHKLNTKNKTKVVAAMSGGVDSSVTAALLQEKGFNVVGVFMKCWDDANSEHCTAEEDEFWARRAASKIGIPFYSVDLVDEYKKRVVDYFVREYKAGRTPNPDVMCNNEVKFGIFYDKVFKEFGADYMATGHYARLSRESPITNNQSPNEKIKLLKGKDPNKDQTYFLNRVPRERLHNVIFPIGEYTKQEVREMAREFGLPNAEKKDSQGLCFIGKVDIYDFLREYIKPQEGDIVTTEGKKVGTHNGAYFYTIGQRKGLGIGGGVPYYVVDKDIRENKLIVGTKYDDELFENKLHISDVNWLKQPGTFPFNAEASIRYRQEPQECQVYKKDEDNYVLEFTEPQRAVTSGQSAVIYNTEEVVGGGVIL